MKALTAREFRAQFGAKGHGRGGRQSERHEALVSACVLFLTTRTVNGRRVRAFATATGRFTGKRLWGTVGTPDILAFIPASPWERLAAIECKTGEATTTQGQREFLEKTTAGGGLVFVVRDDVSDLRRQWEGFQEDRAW